MTDRRALRLVLENLTRLSTKLLYSPGDKELIGEIRRVFSGVSLSVLEIDLPEREPSLYRMYGNCYTADIHENASMACTVFGLKRKGDKIPMHDHRNSFGFIRVLRGALKVRSYSFTEDSSRYCTTGRIEAKFEGKLFSTFLKYHILISGECTYKESVSGDGNSIAFLDPTKGNIHEVVALENGTAFCDLLTPGYEGPGSCVYYEETEKLAEVGDVTSLQCIPPPRTYFTENIWYNPIS